MRELANSRRNYDPPRPNPRPFFLSRAVRGRCDKQGAEGNPHRARAPRRQPEVCHRSADSRYVCCAQSTASLRVTLSTRLQNSQLTSYLIHAVHAGVAYTWFLQRGWLPMATNYDWLGGVRYNGSCCNGDGRSRPTVPSNHVHLHCYRLAWVLCHRSRVTRLTAQVVPIVGGICGEGRHSGIQFLALCLQRSLKFLLEWRYTLLKKN